MIIDVKRGGVTPHVRKVPTATCAVILPMTLDRVGQELSSDTEEPVKVESAQDAFTKLKPKLVFQGRAGFEETEFVADLQFENLRDFEPDNILKHHGTKNEDNEIVYRRNDLADLRNGIDRLRNLKKQIGLPGFRRAWEDPSQRGEIVAAISELKAEMEKLSPPKSALGGSK